MKGGPVVAAVAGSGGGAGFFRNFIYANPPFASTAVHQAITWHLATQLLKLLIGVRNIIGAIIK